MENDINELAHVMDETITRIAKQSVRLAVAVLRYSIYHPITTPQGMIDLALDIIAEQGNYRDEAIPERYRNILYIREYSKEERACK